MKVKHRTKGKLVERALEFRAAVMKDTFGVEDDRDQWDTIAHHVIAVEGREVIGYYRAIEDSELGFYTESEFDISGLALPRNQILEIGRASVRSTNPIVMLGLWKAVLDLAKQLDKRYIIGTASLKDSVDIEAAMAKWRQQYGYLQKGCAVPKNPFFGVPAGGDGIPKLIQVYEKIGAVIASDPCWDPVFNTADVVTVVDIDHINERWLNKLLGD